MAAKLLTAAGGGITLDAASTATDKTLTLPADNGTIVYANSSGNVGIGTNSNLLSNGSRTTVSVNGTSSSAVALGVGGTRTGHLYSDAAYTELSATSGYLSITAGGSERAQITTGGQRKSTIIGGGGSMWNAYDCRAWVNFNGTGTVAIRDSGNVSSITDAGTGDWNINFSTAMPDTNYSVTTGFYYGTNDNGKYANMVINNRTTSLVELYYVNPGVASYDCSTVCAAIFR